RLFGVQRPGDARHRRSAEEVGNVLAGATQSGHVAAGLYAQAIEQVQEVLACDVAGRALRVRTASESRDRAVERGHAHLQRRVYVDQRLPIGVVKMPSELAHWDDFRDRRD